MSTPYVPAPDVKARAVETLRAEAVERLAAVARLRAELAAVAEEKETQETALLATLKPLADRAADLKVQVALAEQEAKALALDLYRAEPANKKPVPGISIKEKRTLSYNATDALAWAKTKGLFLVPESLDVKAFEKFIVDSGPVEGLTWTSGKTPQAQIDSSLPIPAEAVAAAPADASAAMPF